VTSLRGRFAIVGAAETDQLGRIPDMTELELHAQAARRAIADAGLDKEQIDGLASGVVDVRAVADCLDLQPSYVDGTNIGGSSPMIQLSHAVAALNAGYCRYVLITHGESGRSRVAAAPWPDPSPDSIAGQFERPYGLTGPPNTFTLPIAAHMDRFGTTEEQLASVAVTARQWAALNPRALRRDPLTVADVLASPVIAWPIHALECCLLTDGGGAIVVTTAERALDAPKPPVYVLGTGEGAENHVISSMRDLSRSRALEISAQRAYRLSGITPADIDHLMLYDAFAHTPLYGLESLGVVGPGESGPWFEAGRGAPGGELPVNTNGGGLSYTHTGNYGMFALLESVRQLRGEAAAQLPGVEISVAHGPAGFFAAAGTAVLGRSPG
jgi:acetyl-CoA acetyltransferase